MDLYGCYRFVFPSCGVCSAIVILKHVFPIDLDTLGKVQDECKIIGPIKKYIVNGDLPSLTKEARRITIESEQYIVENGLLYHLYQPLLEVNKKNTNLTQDRMIKQLVIPVNMRSEVLKTYHDAIVGGGHKCGVRIYAAIRQIYYWPQLYRDVEEYAKYCEACQKSKRLTKSATAPITTTSLQHQMDINIY